LYNYININNMMKLTDSPTYVVLKTSLISDSILYKNYCNAVRFQLLC